MIIAFDPGYHTGIVAAYNVNYQTRSYDLARCSVVEYPVRAHVQDWLSPSNWAEPIEAIIIEDFLLYKDKALAQTGSRFEAVKVIERITMCAELAGLESKIVMQLPAIRLSAKGMPPEHAKIIAPNRHLTAAYQHLRYYIFSQKHKKGAQA